MATPVHADVIVIGAGVSGLTTAVCLAEAGLRVRVLAKDPPGLTTSAVAGASWGPYLVTDSRVLGWSRITLDELSAIARTDPGSGVRLVPGIEATEEELVAPDWAHNVPGFRTCGPDELPPGYVSGWRYTIPLMDMPAYLSYLENRLAAAGTTVETVHVGGFDELAGQAAVVVNCTGMGARQLVPDDEVAAVRGQLVVVKNPGVDYFFQDQSETDELTYFLPHGDHVVLGGSAITGWDDARPDPAIAARIVDRCARVEPLFRDAVVLENRVGFRPTRPLVRVERDGDVIHNYGHGGSGVTLSWGCAQEVLAQITGTG